MIESFVTNTVVKNVNMQIETKIKKHVSVQYLGTKGELILDARAVKLADVQDAPNRTLFSEDKTLNIILKTRSNKSRRNKYLRTLKQEMAAAKIV